MATDKTNTKERKLKDDENLVNYPGRNRLSSSIQGNEVQQTDKEDKKQTQRK